MMKRPLPALLAVGLGALSLTALAQQYAPGFGPNPTLPAPEQALIPTINIAKADPWPQGMHPTPAAGLAATAYGTGLDHPRWLYVLPNGDVLVAESNKPGNAPKETGIKAKVQGLAQKHAGAGVESPNRIVLLRGVGADGAAASKTTFMEGLNSPFGMALVGSDLYIANADALWKFPYQTGATTLTAQGTKVMDLPAGINHHWTKNVIAAPDGKHLYVTVGSNSNAADNGMEIEAGRAAIWEYDVASGKARIYASGLRNPNGMGFQPQSRALWVTVNERDELGNELVPDYMTAVKEGAFYGWPYSYYGQHVDTRVKPQRPELVAQGHPARLCAGRPHGVAGPGLLRGQPAAAIQERRIDRPARFVEPQAVFGLQADLRPVRQRQAERPAARRADRLPRRQGRTRLRAPGRRRGR